jgi:threonine/homoserine/homoserine lactone efflux protein
VSSAFLITTFVIVATPGTGVIYTLGAALGRGHRAAVVAALGCTLGTLPHLVAAITGLAAVLHASGVAFAVLKYVGVAYLLYMAFTMFRSGGGIALDASRPRSDLRVIGDGVLVNLLNPKLTLFFFAFLPQFVAADGSATLQMLRLSAVFVAVTFVVFVAYGLLAATVREHVLHRERVMAWVSRVFGATLAALAGKLAFASRS